MKSQFRNKMFLITREKKHGSAIRLQFLKKKISLNLGSTVLSTYIDAHSPKDCTRKYSYVT